MLAPTLDQRLLAPSALVWRAWRGPQDNRALAGIGRRCNLADHVDDVITVTTVANMMAYPANFNPLEDVLIGEIEGRPVAWQQVQWRRDEGRYLYQLRGYVSPGWRRRGIGRALLRLGERRARQMAAGQIAGGHPAGAERYLSTFSSERRVGKVALFQSEGYQPVRYFYTMRHRDLDHLPPAPLPAGLELRPPRPDQWRAIWDAKEDGFRGHWMPTEMTDADYQRWQQDPDFDPSLWQIAWDTATNQIAGVSLNSIPQAPNAPGVGRRGIVEELSVRPPWRRRGLGQALLVNSLVALRARGMTEVELGVDSENPTGALRLYERVGFRPVERSMALRKMMEMGS